MLNRLFPLEVNNNYTGSIVAKWMLVLITFLSIARSLIHMFAPDGGAQSIATIPLDTFTTNGAATVILMMALWGSSQIVMTLIYIVVLWRYQRLIPFMYCLIFFEYTLRMLCMHIKPIYIAGTAPGHVADYIMIPLALLMLGLSLKARRNVEQP